MKQDVLLKTEPQLLTSQGERVVRGFGFINSDISNAWQIEPNSLDNVSKESWYTVDSSFLARGRGNDTSVYDPRFENNEFRTANSRTFYKNHGFDVVVDSDNSIVVNYRLHDLIEGISIMSQIDELQNSIDVDATLDYIFDKFESLLINKKNELCDMVLYTIQIENLKISSMVGILTITSEWKAELQCRSLFYSKVFDYINAHFLKEEAKQILEGLE